MLHFTLGIDEGQERQVSEIKKCNKLNIYSNIIIKDNYFIMKIYFLLNKNLKDN